MELVGWLQIAHEDGHRIDQDAGEEILVTTVDKNSGAEITTRVTVPLVTFFRTEEAANQGVRKGRPR